MKSMLLLLSIALPLIGGARLLIRKPSGSRARNIWCEAVALLTSLLVWILLLSGGTDPVHVYTFTGDFSINFFADGPSMLFAGMVSVMWPLVLIYAFSYMEHSHHRNGFFAFYLMTYGITLGVAFAADLVTMYVFFEMLTLVTIPLVCHYQDHDSLYAGRLYAAYTIGGASLAFIAVIVATMDGGSAFVYGGRIAGVFDKKLLLIAFLFGFFGFGAKAAVFPLFRWLPVAGVAPTPVTALLHAVAVVNSGVFAVARLTWYTFGPELLSGSYVQTICLLTASFTLVFAALMAVRQRHLKRRLAYSTVSNLSYMIFGIMLLTPDGLAAGFAHMLFHGIIKITLFMCAGAFMHVTGNEYIYELNGVGRKMPYTFGFYTIGALSLTGIPLFCGFVSKLSLVLAGAAQGSAPAVIGTASLITAAFLCAIYTISISIRAFFPAKGTERYQGGAADADLRMLVPIGVFSFVNVLFGMFPGPIMGFLEKIAAGLI
ncbi:MAG: proton-conducting membrane transporter [Lachnospiraceae bacterium]|nr:proton-conducting membrane transporter [Lachnospiraceae bacterium]